ncbi:MAG: YHS domain-containing (seleno)protein [Phycisphaerales bacterium]
MKRTSSLSIVGAALVMLIGLTVWGASAPGPMADETSRAYLHSFSLPSTGIALEGYCPVAYFAVNKPVRGKPEFASTYNDVTYYLVSADAKKAFDRNPEKYIPAFGGWCAFGMSIQDKFPVDPTNFKIVNGRLMVFLKNRNVDALDLWNQGNDAQLIAKADAHWKKVSK